MNRWLVIVRIPGKKDETILLTDADRKSLFVEAENRGVHPDVVLREAYLRWQPKQQKSLSSQKWEELESAASRFAKLAQFSPSAIDHKALASTLVALTAILRTSVVRGEPEGIQTTVMVAERLALEIQHAFELHPEKLRNVAESLPELAVLVSRATVADNNSERRKVKEFLVKVGVGTRATRPTATKTQTDTTWARLAEMTLEDILLMRAALSYQSHGNACWDSLMLPMIGRAKAYEDRLTKLPPLSPQNVRPWLDIAEELLMAYWRANPAKYEEAIKEAENDKGCRKKQMKGHTFAIEKVSRCFRALAKASGQAKMDERIPGDSFV